MKRTEPFEPCARRLQRNIVRDKLDYVRRAVGETDAPLHSYFALVADDPSVQIVSNAQTWYIEQMMQGTEHEGLPILSAAAPFKAGGRGGPEYYTEVQTGPIAIRNVADLYLYPNTVRAVRITGADVREWLERSAGMFNQIVPGQAVTAPLVPKDGEKCPVCGMFVKKYPDFLAQIVFADGNARFFDGVKDLFKYFFDMERYTNKQTIDDIAFIYVSDYYSLEPIEGQSAWYVAGSAVYGPMGKELIPFAGEDDARQFMQDHEGKSLLRFEQITPELISELD